MQDFKDLEPVIKKDSPRRKLNFNGVTKCPTLLALRRVAVTGACCQIGYAIYYLNREQTSSE